MLSLQYPTKNILVLIFPVSISAAYLGKEVMNAINSEVESCKSTGQEASPPPMVILNDNVSKTEFY